MLAALGTALFAGASRMEWPTFLSFNLIGAVNLASNSLGSLFNTTSLNEVGVGMVSWPIFHGGEAHANIRAKEEEEQQDYLAYQKAVLAAVQDSEDALVRYAAEQRRYLALGKALARDQSSTTIALQQYQAGLTNYVNVLTAQSNELQVNDQLAQSKQALAADAHGRGDLLHVGLVMV